MRSSGLRGLLGQVLRCSIYCFFFFLLLQKEQLCDLGVWRGQSTMFWVGSVRSGEQVRREAEETPGPLSSCHQAAQQEMPRKLREESCGPSSLA